MVKCHVRRRACGVGWIILRSNRRPNAHLRGFAWLLNQHAGWPVADGIWEILRISLTNCIQILVDLINMLSVTRLFIHLDDQHAPGHPTYFRVFFFVFYDLPSPLRVCDFFFRWTLISQVGQDTMSGFFSLSFHSAHKSLTQSTRWKPSRNSRLLCEKRHGCGFNTFTFIAADLWGFYLASREYLEMRSKIPAAAMPLAQINSFRWVNLLRFAMSIRFFFLLLLG